MVTNPGTQGKYRYDDFFDVRENMTLVANFPLFSRAHPAPPPAPAHGHATGTVPVHVPRVQQPPVSASSAHLSLTPHCHK